MQLTLIHQVGTYGTVIWKDSPKDIAQSYKITSGDMDSISKTGSPPNPPYWGGTPQTWDALWQSNLSCVIGRPLMDTASGEPEADTCIAWPDGSLTIHSGGWDSPSVHLDSSEFTGQAPIITCNRVDPVKGDIAVVNGDVQVIGAPEIYKSLGAAVIDNSSSSGGAFVSSVTYSHTVTSASNGIIVSFLSTQGSGSAGISSYKWNGTDLTFLIDTTVSAAAYLAAYILQNTTVTGAHNITISFSGASVIYESGTISLTGILQSGPTYNLAGQTSGSNSISLGLSNGTTDMIIAFYAEAGATGGITSGGSPTAEIVQRSISVPSTHYAILTSVIGDVNHVCSASTGATTVWTLLAIPCVAVISGPVNVSGWDGLPLASAFTILGVPLASVKSINGLT